MVVVCEIHACLLGGSGGMLSQENFEFIYLSDCFWRTLGQKFQTFWKIVAGGEFSSPFCMKPCIADLTSRTVSRSKVIDRHKTLPTWSRSKKKHPFCHTNTLLNHTVEAVGYSSRDSGHIHNASGPDLTTWPNHMSALTQLLTRNTRTTGHTKTLQKQPH